MSYSSHFIADPTFIHLNAGSLTKTPLSVLQFQESFRREQEKNPTRSLYLAPKIFSAAQEFLAREFGCVPEDLFFRSNITSALNDFLFGVPLQGEEILITSWEYGATHNLAKLRAQQSGWKLRIVDLPVGEEITAQEIAERIAAAVTEKTGMLVVSHVATGLGTILPLAEIIRDAQAKGCVVVVDGAHAPGALSLNIQAFGADFYGGNLHKWFLGPWGTAFGWVHPKWRGKIAWKFGGWASFSVPSHFSGVLQDPEAAQRFFPGTMDPAPFAALEALGSFWQTHGRENLRAYQKSLRVLVETRGKEMGWQVLSPRENLGPLYTFALPKAWQGIPNLAYRLYTEANVQVAIPNMNGEPVLRFSPGVYVTKDEVELGLQKLHSWKP
jgi:isopenicillin-N epimerase